MFIRSPYNYDMSAASLESGLVCDPDEDMTQQQFKDECDINEITRRFGLGYAMPEGVRVPQYGDFTGLSSYHEACNAIAQAGEAFDALPALVRERFGNDPGRFVDFVVDEKNRDEAVMLGIVQAKEPVKVVPEPVAAAVVSAVAQQPALQPAGEVPNP